MTKDFWGDEGSFGMPPGWAIWGAADLGGKGPELAARGLTLFGKDPTGACAPGARPYSWPYFRVGPGVLFLSSASQLKGFFLI